LGDELDEELVPLLLLWWPFLPLLVDEGVVDLPEEVAGVVDAGAEVDWANAGPAIRAAATTGIRYLNIIAVVSERIDLVSALRAARVPAGSQGAKARTLCRESLLTSAI
jgi:thioester reductase-like protein